MKIAIGDEIPLELNHCLDGVTTPVKSSRTDFHDGNNTTEARAMEERQNDMRQEVNHKMDYSTVNINNNAASSQSDSKPVVSAVSPKVGSSTTNLPTTKNVSFHHEHNHVDNSRDLSTEKDQTASVTQVEGFLEREV